MNKPFIYRGPNVFYFARKKYPLSPLVSIMAEQRIIRSGSGGHWSGNSGDGEAWRNEMNRYGKFRRIRSIRAGKWNNPWRYELME